mgnify:CR=1 FL=1
MSNVTVYGMAQSVYTQIVLLVLDEKKVAYDLQETNVFSDQTVSNIGKLNPFKKIPVLLHNNFKLYETSAITRYIDETFPGASLQPSDTQERARMHQIIALLDAHAYTPMIWGLFVQLVALPQQGKDSDISIIEGALHKTSICLDALTNLISKQVFLASSQLSLADLHAFPILYHLSLTSKGATQLSNHLGISNWLEAMATRLSIQNITLVK